MRCRFPFSSRWRSTARYGNPGQPPKRNFRITGSQSLRAGGRDMAAACAITILCGFSFPRYSYLAAAHLPGGRRGGQGMGKGIYPRKITDWLHVALAAAGITFAVGTVVLVVLCLLAHAGNAGVVIRLRGPGVGLSGLVIRWICAESSALGGGRSDRDDSAGRSAVRHEGGRRPRASFGGKIRRYRACPEFRRERR